MAKERKLVLNPPADLEPRAGDVSLPPDRLLGISLFARLKKKPNLERFPGTLILRRYRRGEVIFRQGEAGWTAFYALTGDDLRALQQGQPATAPEPEQPALRAKASGTPRPVATVSLVLGRGPESAERGVLHRLKGRLLPALGRADEPVRRWLPWIPISNLRDVCPDARQATLYEGELFGDVSCMYGAPRAVTIVAADDCYVLEMLRNILDEIQADEAYRAHMDALYR